MIGQFLNALYEYKEPNHYICIWHPLKKGGGQSAWFADINDAEQYVTEKFPEGSHDCYIQIGLADRAHGKYQRCSKRENNCRPVVALPGLWADIDISHDVHQRSNLPRTQGQAMAIIKNNGFDPTLIINSGHGLQAYWLFKEPWIIPTKEDRHEATALLVKLKKELLYKAKTIGKWHIDAVQDIARVMRMPGTFNHKDEEDIKPVSIIEYNDHIRYNPDDLNDLIPDRYDQGSLFDDSDEFDTEKVIAVKYDPEALKTVKDLADMTDEDIENQPDIMPREDGSIVLDVGALPPLMKFNAILENSLRFSQTWHMRRDDLKEKDDSASPSAYDMSLIHQTLDEEWNDQEIANLIISFRRANHLNVEKALRKDYIIGSITKARTARERHDAQEKIEIVTNIANTSYENLTNKNAIQEAIRKIHGVKVLKIIKFTGDKNTYRFCTDKGDVDMESVKDWQYPGKLRERLLDKINVIFKYDKKHWDQTLQLFTQLIVEEQISEDENLTSRAKTYIKQYLESKPVQSAEEAAQNRNPFVKNGNWYIFIAKIHHWAKFKYGEDCNSKELRKAFYDLNCKERRIRIARKINGKASTGTVTVWEIPKLIIGKAMMDVAKKRAQEDFFNEFGHYPEEIDHNKYNLEDMEKPEGMLEQ